MSWIRNAVLVLISILVTLILVEKLYYSGNSFYGAVSRSVLLREPQINISRNNYPTDLYMKNMDKKSLKQKEYKFTTNSDGFIIGPKESNIDFSNPDLAFFGGSTTELAYVDEDKRFPYLVSELLSSKSRKVKSLNLGNSGNNSMHSIVNLIAKVIEKKPKLAIMMHNVNDLSGLIRTGSYWDTARGRAIVQTQKKEGYFYNFIRNTKDFLFPNLYRSFVLAFGSPNPLSTNEWSGVHTLGLRESDITAPFKNSLKTFVSICRDWNIAPVLMTQPNRLNINDVLVKSTYESGSRLKNQFSYKNYIEMYDKFNNIIREVGLSTSTLVIDLDKELSDNDKLIYDAVHLNNNGSEASAKIIAKAILDAYPNL